MCLCARTFSLFISLSSWRLRRRKKAFREHRTWGLWRREANLLNCEVVWSFVVWEAKRDSGTKPWAVEVSNRLGIKLVTTLTSSSIRSTSLITNATQNPIKSNVFSAQQNLQAREKNCSEEIVADFSVFVAPSSAIISQHQAKNPRRSFPLFNPKKHRAKASTRTAMGGCLTSKVNLIW